MTRQLRIGKSSSAPTLPLDAVTRTFGIFGQRGTGKTNTAVVMVEQMVGAGAHVVVIDPKGDWWGITRAGEGKGLAGIVLGGDEGDLPLEETAGQLVAELVVDRHWPVVVADVSRLRKGARRRFLADFLEELYDRNKQALHVVFEEAHQVLPLGAAGQRSDVVLNRVIGAAEDIVTLGRKRGLGISLVSQRFATVNATVREQVETLMLHRLSGPLDRKAARGWIETNGDAELTAKILNEIASYELGTALLYSPGWLGVLERIRVKQRRTFDSSATPEVGVEVVEEAGPRTPVDLAELRERMAETVERAKQNDPAELRKQIHELKVQLEEDKDASYEAGYEAGYAKRAEIKPEPETVEVPVLPRERVDHLEAAADDLRRVTKTLKLDLRDAVDKLHGEVVGAENAATEILAAVARVRDKPLEVPPRATPAPAHTGATETPTRVSAAAPRTASANGGLPKAAVQLLEVAARFHPLRLTKAQLATLARRGTRSSTLEGHLAALSREGLLDRAGGDIGVTDAGLALAGVHPEALSLDTWGRILPDGVSDIFNALRELGGHATKAEIAERAGVSATSSTTEGKLAMLRRNGLVTHRGGEYELTPLAHGR